MSTQTFPSSAQVVEQFEATEDFTAKYRCGESFGPAGFRHYCARARVPKFFKNHDDTPVVEVEQEQNYSE